MDSLTLRTNPSPLLLIEKLEGSNWKEAIKILTQFLVLEKYIMVFFRIQNTLALNQSKFYPFIFWVLTLHFLIVSQLNSVSFTWIYHLFYYSILLKLFCSLIFFTWTNSMLHHLHLSVIVSYLYLFHTFFLCFYCYDYTTTFPIKGQAVCYTLFPFPFSKNYFFFFSCQLLSHCGDIFHEYIHFWLLFY